LVPDVLHGSPDYFRDRVAACHGLDLALMEAGR
jgi:hypothetical protein